MNRVSNRFANCLLLADPKEPGYLLLSFRLFYLLPPRLISKLIPSGFSYAQSCMTIGDIATLFQANGLSINAELDMFLKRFPLNQTEDVSESPSMSWLQRYMATYMSTLSLSIETEYDSDTAESVDSLDLISNQKYSCLPGFLQNLYLELDSVEALKSSVYRLDVPLSPLKYLFKTFSISLQFKSSDLTSKTDLEPWPFIHSVDPLALTLSNAHSMILLHETVSIYAIIPQGQTFIPKSFKESFLKDNHDYFIVNIGAEWIKSRLNCILPDKDSNGHMKTLRPLLLEYTNLTSESKWGFQKLQAHVGLMDRYALLPLDHASLMYSLIQEKSEDIVPIVEEHLGMDAITQVTPDSLDHSTSPNSMKHNLTTRVPFQFKWLEKHVMDPSELQFDSLGQVTLWLRRCWSIDYTSQSQAASN